MNTTCANMLLNIKLIFTWNQIVYFRSSADPSETIAMYSVIRSPEALIRGLCDVISAVSIVAIAMLAPCSDATDAGSTEGLTKLKFSAPKLNEEESFSRFLPDHLKCDACWAVAYQVNSEKRFYSNRNRRDKSGTQSGRSLSAVFGRLTLDSLGSSYILRAWRVDQQLVIMLLWSHDYLAGHSLGTCLVRHYFGRLLVDSINLRMSRRWHRSYDDEPRPGRNTTKLSTMSLYYMLGVDNYSSRVKDSLSR